MERVVLAVVAFLLLPLVHAGSPPSAPTFVVAQTGANVGEIELNWSAPLSSGSSPVAGYRIYRSLTATGLTHLVDLGSTLSFTDTGIPDGAPRYYRVSAVNGDGEGPLAPVVSASAKAPPSVPLAVDAAPHGRGNISVAWSAPEFNGTADILAYNVYRSADATGPFDFLASVASSPHLDTGLGDNATFHYRVAAVNVYGEGPSSDVREGHTPRRPGLPLNVTASFFPVFGIQVSWDAPRDDGGSTITRYHLYRAVGDAPEEHYGLTLGTRHMFTDRDCPLAQECHYRVRAMNAIGLSDFTERVTGLGDSPPIIG